MEDIKAAGFIVDLILAVLGLALSILVHKRTVTGTMLKFYSQGDTKEQKEYRRKIYKAYETKEHNLSAADLKALDHDGTVSSVISFYDTWGKLCRQEYLPLKTFEGITGVTACRMFYIVLPYIAERRAKVGRIRKRVISNSGYGKDFEDFIKKIEDGGLVHIDELPE